MTERIVREPMINHRLFSEFGACVLADYEVGETELTNAVYLGRNRTSWTQLDTTFGMRSLRITVKFFAPEIQECTMLKSLFDGALYGKNELWLPDGYWYSVYAESFGSAAVEANTDRGAILSASYSLKGIRHAELETVGLSAGDNEIRCMSTMPYTDARFSTQVTKAAAQYTLGGAVFKNVTAGERLVFDGISKRILRDGVDNALNVSWLDFPRLTPGFNQITCIDPTTVQYYPTYI